MLPRSLAFLLTIFALHFFLHSAVDAAWQATKIAEVDGFQIPECVVVDTENKRGYVSNVAATAEGEGYERFWADDGNGFISQFSLPDVPQRSRRKNKNQVSVPENLTGEDLARSNEKFRFSGPKGMCLLGDTLWVTDIDRVLVFSVTGKFAPQVVEVPGAVALKRYGNGRKICLRHGLGSRKVLPVTFQWPARRYSCTKGHKWNHFSQRQNVWGKLGIERYLRIRSGWSKTPKGFWSYRTLQNTRWH